MLSGLKHSYDLCTDYTGPISIIGVEPVRAAYVALKSRGIKIRFIAEVTPANIEQCRQLMEFAELRHLDNILGNFALADGTDYAGSSDVDKTTGEIQKLVVSNVRSFVKLQEYFFETLWARAIPAAIRIKQIEDGTEPEVTEIWYGADSASPRSLKLIRGVKKTCDIYLDRHGPFLVCSHPDALEAYGQIKARGGKVRLITEITPGNLQHCKQLAGIMEICHIENVQGNFRIIDSSIYGATSRFEAGENFSYLHSTVGNFVELQQYFFNTLWNNAMPSAARFAEIEQGKKPGRIEVIYDVPRARSLGFEVLQHTKHELLVLFSSSAVASMALDLGAISVYHQLSQRGVKVRVLVPSGSQTEAVLHRIGSIAPSIETRTTSEDTDLQLTILISDRNELMTWETKDEDVSDPKWETGISTYTNFETLSQSYGVIFDNLWKNTEYANRLVASNLELVKKEKAMQEFMDIAAHELRTPIQPVLGLAEQLLEELQLDEKHREHLEIIVRNAKRLQKLQQDILDVTRIDSSMVKLHRQRLDLRELLEEAASNFQSELKSKGIQLKINRPAGLFLFGDREKLLQVIGNVLSNAIKSMEPKGGKARSQDHVILADVQGDRDFVEIKFVDQGEGISADMMPRLFTKFASGSHGGTGLGLYISKAIVEAHGGRIWAENNSGRGATFHVVLPLAGEAPKT